MLKIGITGGIGSGKSTISKIFEVLGVQVFYADDEAKKVMTADPILIDAIKMAFGSKAYFDDGLLNRKYLADIVFNDANKLEQLNAIVHPATFRAFNAWAGQITGTLYIIKEAALLFESNSYLLCDQTIMVYAPLETRMKRVIQRDGLSREQAESRNAKQFADEKKLKMADYVIKNDGSELVIPQVLALHRRFLNTAKGQQ